MKTPYKIAIGIAVVLLGVAAATNRTQLLRSYLFDNMDGNNKSITNLFSLSSSNYIDAATGLPLATGGGAGKVDSSVGVATNLANFVTLSRTVSGAESNFVATADTSAARGVTLSNALAGAQTINQPIKLWPGTYDVGASRTITNTLEFQAGAMLKPASGVTITLKGDIIATPWQRIFDLSAGGTVDVTETPTRTYSVRWFGITPVTSAADMHDDAPLLRSALASIYTGSTLFFPKGKYSFGPITNTSRAGITFIGERTGKGQASVNDTVICYAGPTGGTMFHQQSCQFFVFRNLGFQPNTAHSVITNHANTILSFDGDGSTAHLVENCEMSQTGTNAALKMIRNAAIGANNCEDLVIRNVTANAGCNPWYSASEPKSQGVFFENGNSANARHVVFENLSITGFGTNFVMRSGSFSAKDIFSSYPWLCWEFSGGSEPCVIDNDSTEGSQRFLEWHTGAGTLSIQNSHIANSLHWQTTNAYFTVAANQARLLLYNNIWDSDAPAGVICITNWSTVTDEIVALENTWPTVNIGNLGLHTFASYHSVGNGQNFPMVISGSRNGGNNFNSFLSTMDPLQNGGTNIDALIYQEGATGGTAILAGGATPGYGGIISSWKVGTNLILSAGLSIPFGASLDYVWTCTNATTGKGNWAAAAGGAGGGNPATNLVVRSSGSGVALWVQNIGGLTNTIEVLGTNGLGMIVDRDGGMSVNSISTPSLTVTGGIPPTAWSQTNLVFDARGLGATNWGNMQTTGTVTAIAGFVGALTGNASTATLATNAINSTNFWGLLSLTNLPTTVTTNNAQLLANSVMIGDNGRGVTNATLSEVLDLGGATQGSLLARGASTWALLTPGPSNSVLRSLGSGQNIAWGFNGVGLTNIQLPGLPDTVTTNNSALATQTVRVGNGGRGTSNSVMTIDSVGNVAGISVPSTNVVGTTNGNVGPAGSVGEYIEAAVTNVNAGASTTFYDVTSINVTPGAWDVSTSFYLNANSATFTASLLYCGWSTVSGNSSAGLTPSYNFAANSAASTFAASTELTITTPTRRFNTTTNATLYMKGFVGIYTVGTPLVNGSIMAERAR